MHHNAAGMTLTSLVHINHSTTAMWVIEVILQPTAPNKLFWIKPTAVVTVGRSLSSHIVFSDDKSVSRDHATIELVNDNNNNNNNDESEFTLYVTDLGGKYGSVYQSKPMVKKQRTAIASG